MIAYIGRRLLHGILIVWLVATLVFLLTGYLGDPVAQLLPSTATQEEYDRLSQRLGYDRPLIERYWTFLTSAVQGDFGTSAIYSKPAMGVVLDRLPPTAVLAVAAIILAFAIGVPIGLAGGYRPRGIADRFGLLLSTAGLAIPTFVLGIGLITLFAVQIKILPAAGIEGGIGYILPTLSLGIWAMAALIRFANSETRKVMASPYVVLARAKGLSEFHVVVRHVLPNGLLPVVTYAGLQLGGLLSGTVVTEALFGIPGIGTLGVESVSQRDQPVVIALVMLVAIMFVLVNLLTDILCSVLDPRIRLTRRGAGGGR